MEELTEDIDHNGRRWARLAASKDDKALGRLQWRLYSLLGADPYSSDPHVKVSYGYVSILYIDAPLWHSLPLEVRTHIYYYAEGFTDGYEEGLG